MDANYHFSVYEHSLIFKENQILIRKFIVLKDSSNQIVKYTDFHRYIKSSKKKYVRRITDDGNSRAYYIAKFLNYVFFDKYHITKLNDLTVTMVAAFLNDYGKGLLNDDRKERSKNTVEICVRTIMDFLECYIDANMNACSIRKEELLKTVKVRNSRGKIITKNIPAFDVLYSTTPKHIFRDMPDAVFDIFLNHIIASHKDILMLAVLSAFAGLRPSEACNVRREDSILSPGLRFTIVDGEVEKIEIDLKKELNLRSDLLFVGGIKKERIQCVHPAFIKAFTGCYNIYMEYIKGRKYEADYGALSVNKQGKAITYASYYGKFKTVIKEVIPILLQNEDPEVVNYGQLLMENTISPHIFRHWFSVKLTLFGEDVSGLMYWRGDTAPESALTYLQNKGELQKQYQKVNNKLFDYYNWKAAKLYVQNRLE